MAALYEIDNAILNCIDQETGEIIDEQKLEELQIERAQKIEGVALWVKNLESDAAAYKAEKDSFAEKEKAAKNKIESLKNWLSYATGGQKFNFTRVNLSYRKSESVEIPDETIIPKKYLVKKVTFAPDKNAIKLAIKSGLKVKGAVVVERQNIQIK